MDLYIKVPWIGSKSHTFDRPVQGIFPQLLCDTSAWPRPERYVHLNGPQFHRWINMWLTDLGKAPLMAIDWSTREVLIQGLDDAVLVILDVPEVQHRVSLFGTKYTQTCSGCVADGHMFWETHGLGIPRWRSPFGSFVPESCSRICWTLQANSLSDLHGHSGHVQTQFAGVPVQQEFAAALCSFFREELG